jgi:hypothetical protein
MHPPAALIVLCHTVAPCEEVRHRPAEGRRTHHRARRLVFCLQLGQALVAGVQPRPQHLRSTTHSTYSQHTCDVTASR